MQKRIEITKNWLELYAAPPELVKFWKKEQFNRPERLINALIKKDLTDWASWIITRTLSRRGKLRYALYAMTLTLPAIESDNPTDKSTRTAINACREVLRAPLPENKEAAFTAAKEVDGYYAFITSEAAEIAETRVIAQADLAFDADAIDEIFRQTIPRVAKFEAEKVSKEVFLTYLRQKKTIRQKILNYGIELLQKE